MWVVRSDDPNRGMSLAAMRGFSFVHLYSNFKPNKMKPALGKIVIYECSEQDIKKQEALNALGKGCNVSKRLPAVIVTVWSSTPEEANEQTVVNLKVMLDGNSCLWVTSAHQGDQPGQWHE